jgi:hypothetical protein
LRGSDAGRGLLSEPDLETVLDRLLETAAELTGGELSVQPGTQAGTVIRARLPLG